LFQLPTLPAGTILDKTNKDHMRIVQFISKAFSDPETRYHTTEREGLAVIRCLEEVRWLVMQAMDIPVMVYTDHKSLLSILDGSLAKESPNAARSARIDRWQLRLAEYNLKFEHIPGGENKIADGLSRLPVSALEVGVAGREDDLVEALVAEAMEAQVQTREEDKKVVGAEREVVKEAAKRSVGKTRKKVIGKEVEEVEKASQGDKRYSRKKKAEKAEKEVVGEEVENMVEARRKKNVGKQVKMTEEQKETGTGHTRGEEAEKAVREKRRDSGSTKAEPEIRGAARNVGGEEAEKMVEEKTKAREGKKEMAKKEEVGKGRKNEPGKAEIERRGVNDGEEKDGHEGEKVLGTRRGGVEAEVVAGESVENGQRRVEVMVVGKGGDGEKAVEGCGSERKVEGIEGGEGVEGSKAEDGQRRVGDGAEAKSMEAEEMRRKVREGKLRNRWEKWLRSEWYGTVVEYRLFGRDGGDGSRSMRRRMEKKAADFRLIDAKGAVPRLAYIERNGAQSWCILPEQVNEVLRYAHDCHGHFAEALTLKQLVGKFYWPSRAKDTPIFCRSCQNCQYYGPKKPSQIQKPILHLQPLDMIGIDYLGPFNPVCEGTNNRYVILVVDYFSRFAWARAVECNDGETAVRFLLEEIVKVFGWPASVYSDNGPHFVQGVLPQVLAANGVRHFPAPKSHPSSVGLIEKYVQLILYGLRRHTLLEERGKFIWDRFLPMIIYGGP
jgi:hypothetical protein